MEPHKWQKEIIAWANGETIQGRYLPQSEDWVDLKNPIWDVENEYRIKPKEEKWQKVKDHWEKGGKIQYKAPTTGNWIDLSCSRDFKPNWYQLEWRIKPEQFKWQKEKDHWEKGGKIQYKNLKTGDWEDYYWQKSKPNWYQFEWRIKPEPKIEYSFNDQVRDEIDSILDCFDFQRVLEVMTALDWTWWDTDGVPEIWDLRKMARERLREAVRGLIRTGEKRYYSACGGFFAEAEIEEGNPKIYMKLSFVVSDWDNYYD